MSTDTGPSDALEDVLQRVADVKGEFVPKHLVLELAQVQEDEYSGLANRNYDKISELQQTLHKFRRQLVVLLVVFIACMVGLGVAALVTNNRVEDENAKLQQQQAQIQHSRYLELYNQCQTDKAKRAAFISKLTRDFPTQVGDQNFRQLVDLITTVVPDRPDCRAYARAKVELGDPRSNP